MNIESYPAYFLFVRGNRSVQDTGRGITTLRATGSLKQGTQVTTVPGISTNAFTLVGNPYASPIDFDKIYKNTGTKGILRQFTVWNSNLGTYGAYELVKWVGTNYAIVPYPFTDPADQNDRSRYISSGSGFFVQPVDNTGGTVTIREGHKAPNMTALVNPFRLIGKEMKLYVNLNLKNSDTSATLADGVLARFGEGYNADMDEDDASKLPNLYENLSIVSNSTDLMMETKPNIVQTDTVKLKLWNVSKKSYQFQLKADSFDSLSMHAWLEDSYLKTKQEVKLNGDITTINFDVTS